MNTDPPKIQDYAVIGDGRSAALVSRHGSIDWLCWPRFDSSAIFAAILDSDRGGFWSLAPADITRADREYMAASNVIRTSFTTTTGKATLTELMPVASEDYKRGHLF